MLRDQFHSFVASCTGLPNTRVGLYYYSRFIEFYFIRFLFSATWRSPLQIDIKEDETAR